MIGHNEKYLDLEASTIISRMALRERSTSRLFLVKGVWDLTSCRGHRGRRLEVKHVIDDGTGRFAVAGYLKNKAFSSKLF